MRYWPCVIDLNKSTWPVSSIIILSAKYRSRCECKIPKILIETFGNNKHKSFKKTSCYKGNEIMNQVSSYLFEATQLENNFNSKKDNGCMTNGCMTSEGIICFIYHGKSFLRMDYHFYDWSIKRRELADAKHIFRLLVEYYSKKVRKLWISSKFESFLPRIQFLFEFWAYPKFSN